MPMSNASEPYREEHDSMGAVRVPAHAYYGSQTQRAVDNFAHSGLKPPLSFLHALALIKRCAAQTNRLSGVLEGSLAEAIVSSANSS